ncbi:unnamed protein product [Caenorhabditis bovis]|uniref:HAT C-terminal dimerisation domain-containing protein n=1 Tax=Caenorhabditis bovis TaxID=2654633 RepID=A0A8S1EM43_9PELO|nr:unnamed protein product [Caenorhabditis bovis]
MEISPTKLKKRDEIRWECVYDTLKRALSCKEAIDELTKCQSSIPSLDENDWLILKNTYELLEPLAGQTDMSQSQSPMASTIIPLCNFLIAQMKNSPNFHEPAQTIVERMELELEIYKKIQYLRFATIMDPRYKELEKYLALPPEVTIEPLAYWTSRITTSTFPLLIKEAERYFICPAGSAHIQDVFSSAELILNPTRKSMSSDDFNRLVFLNRNLQHYGS